MLKAEVPVYARGYCCSFLLIFVELVLLIAATEQIELLLSDLSLNMSGELSVAGQPPQLSEARLVKHIH
jgi:hypothetical protein